MYSRDYPDRCDDIHLSFFISLHCRFFGFVSAISKEPHDPDCLSTLGVFSQHRFAHSQMSKEHGLLKALSWRSPPVGRLTDGILKYYNHCMHPAEQYNVC